jgi:hypothetical protein
VEDILLTVRTYPETVQAGLLLSCGCEMEQVSMERVRVEGKAMVK